MNITGTWNLKIDTPRGALKPVLTLAEVKSGITGTMKMPGNPARVLTDCKRVGTTVTMNSRITVPAQMTMAFSMEFAGNSVTGTCKAGSLPTLPVTGSFDETKVDRRSVLVKWKDFLFG